MICDLAVDIEVHQVEVSIPLLLSGSLQLPSKIFETPIHEL